ncbi:MAG: amidohydrolase family protein [Chloroflexi bacterium]|nr:amidohydrolase family protein [Chloroflexota bacterium]
MMLDLVIAGGQVVDGTGSAPVRADVGIAGGRIVAVADLTAAEGAARFDATGRVVAPGFVDIHSHSDFTLLVDPAAQSALSQGVTTEVVGNCGHGCAPLGGAGDPRFTGNIYGWGEGVRALDWHSVSGYLDALEDARPAINLATLVPFGNLRLLAMEDQSGPARSHELATMTRELEAGLDAGAVGLSTGLEYPAEASASGGELYALASTVARRGRLYATHTRDRGTRVVEGTHEAIETLRATGVRTQVAHILARRGSGGVEANARIAELLEGAASDGLPVAWDVHTRTFGITNLSSALPLASSAPGELRVDRGDPNVVSSFGRAGWDRAYLLEAGVEGSVADAAAERGVTPRDLLVAVLEAATAAGDVHRPMILGHTYTEEDIAGAVRTSRCAVGSDATTMDLGSRLLARLLPGAFTWAAWYLRRIVREVRALPLPEAIRRITSLPALQAGLADRGRLVAGARADIVVFDLAAVREPADAIRPEALATGVDLVLVNGQPAWDGGRPTGIRAGEVIRA